ncbi:MAG TPA: tetratricopeptide repeat protein [Polyangiaceae bacterium]|nr:tetratricopeptide repeat protein [Polyangiaceae bacterium]
MCARAAAIVAGTRLATSLVLASGAVGCSAGSVGEAIRPGDPRATDALGEKCKSVGGEAQPLVVDLPQHERADLEEAIKSGKLAVLAYDCSSLKLLKSCSAPGSYAFASLAPKTQTIVLENADEIRTNLPSFGPAIAVKLEGEIARGATLDLGMMMVGKRRTTVTHLDAGDLEGDCRGATHFVRGVYVGAFKMSTGTRGKARLETEIFGAGAGTSSESEKLGMQADGDVEACRAFDPSASTAPPAKCDSLLRLELASVGTRAEDARDAKKAALSTASTWHACGEGQVFAEGKCVAPTEGRAFQCRSDQPIECGEQCGHGHGGSCATLGLLYERGLGVARDASQAKSYFDKGCKLGDAYACTNLGVLFERGDGGAADPAAATKLYGESCERGDENACFNLGLARELGRGIEKDEGRARDLYRRACDGGEAAACNNLGFMLEHGKGGAIDEPASAKQYERACEGGLGEGCYNLALLHELGRGTRKDAMRAASLYVEACEKKSSEACASAATFFEEGTTVPRDLARAESLYKQACDAGAGKGCHGLGSLKERGEGTAASPTDAAALYDKGCKLGDLDACSDFAVLVGEGRGVPKDEARARGILEGACTAGHGTACCNLGAMLELGKGGPKNAARAADIYEKACTGGTPAGCGNLGEMIETGAGGRKRDKDAAIVFYRKACEGGHDTSCKALSRLGAR